MDAFTTALRAVMAAKLEVDPAAIVNARVDWEDGDRYDPTYGDTPNAAPTFRVVVTTRSSAVNGNGYYLGPYDTDTEVAVDFVFTELLRLCLGIE